MDHVLATYVFTKEDLQSAHQLRSSTLYSASNFPLIVLVSSKMPEKLLYAVRDTFEHVQEIFVPEIFEGKHESVYFKISCWSFTLFCSVTIVPPNALVLKNCDTKFFKSTTNILNLQEGLPDSKVVHAIPCTKHYKDLKSDFWSFYDLGNDSEASLLKAISKIENVAYEQFLTDVDINNISYSIWTSLIIVNQVQDLTNTTLADGLTKEALTHLNNYYAEIKKLTQTGCFGYNMIRSEPIAIIGLSCRFPKANNVDEFWRNLMAGTNCIQEPPLTRWTKKQSCNQIIREKSLEAGFLSASVETLDGLFFGINHSELIYTDPQQRLLMQVAWEAVENAGVPAFDLHGTDASIYVGMWTQDYKELMIESGFKKQEFYRTYMGNGFAGCSARLARMFGTTGETITLESGCASSMIAIGQAVANLRLKKSEIAIAGGVNLILKPFCHKDFEMVCSADARCKSFDEKADGYARSEGAAVIVLKRLSDAVSNNDNILGIITGYGQTQDSLSPRMGRPSVEGEAKAMKLALMDAAVHPNVVTYVEAHGTGTQIGDSLELEAIKQVYCSNRKSELFVGAVKSNIGHSESCSGMASILKVLECFRNCVIPKNINFNNVSNQIELGDKIQIVVTETHYEELPNHKRIVGINNYGITGTNAHLIVEEPPKIFNASSNSSLPNYIFVLSAKNERVLQLLKENFITFLSETRLSTNEICSTLAIRRQQFSNRIAVFGKSISSIKVSLQKNLFIQASGKQFQNPKICFLFPGQGSQIDNLGKLLFENVPSFRKAVMQCDKYLCTRFGISVVEILWGDNSILKKKYDSCGILAIQFAICQLLKDCRIKPDIVLGYGLGEYAAACASGILDIKDAIFLIVKKAELVEKIRRVSVVAVNCSPLKALNLVECAKKIDSDVCLEVVAENSGTEIMVAGDEFSLTCLHQVCASECISSTTAQKDCSFYSHLIEPVLGEFHRSADLITHNAPACTYLSSFSSAQTITKVSSQYWVDQLRNIVKFKEVCNNLPVDNVIFIEIGPKCILSNLVKENLPKTKTNSLFLYTLGNAVLQQWEAMILALGKLYVEGFNVDWKPLYGHLTQKVVSLPSYPMEYKSSWFPEQKANTNVHPRVQLNTCKKPEPVKLNENFKLQRTDIILDSIIDLNLESYLCDHIVGSSIILPGAYYIENILRASNLQKNDSESFLECTTDNFVLKKAIKVNPSVTTVLRTNITSTGSVKISTQQSNGENLVNCTANFNIKETTNSLQFLKNVNTTNWDLVIPDTFYNNVFKTGIKFGDSFRSLSSIFITHYKVFAEIVCPSFGKYVIHPILIDSMLQAAYIATYGVNCTSLVLPVFIKEIVVTLPIHDQDSFKVYSYISKQRGAYSVLINDQNQILLKMNRIDFATTSLAQAETVINSTNNPLFFREVWKQDMQFGNCKFPIFNSIFNKEKESDNQKSLVIEQNILNRAIGIEIYKAFRKIWTLQKSPFILEKALCNLPGYPGLSKLISHLLSYLEADKYCTVIYDEGRTEVNWLDCYDNEQEEAKISSLLKNISNLKVEYVFASNFLQNFELFLSCKLNPLTLMFPVSKTDKSSAYNFYATSLTSKHAKMCLRESFEKVLSKIPHTAGTSCFLNIIEIGGGTGNGTTVALKLLEAHNINFCYTFTDISSAFFSEANTLFDNFKQKWQCKTLNIEKDPKSQGFAPFQYDMVIAVNVIHATSNIHNSLSNIRHLLKPQGIFFLLETFAPQRSIDVTFGLLPGYWNFTDTSIRPNHCLVSANVWKSVLADTGFAVAESVEAEIGGNGVVCAQASNELFLFKSTETLLTITHNSENFLKTDCIVKHLIAGGCNVQIPSSQKICTNNIRCNQEYNNKYGSQAEEVLQEFLLNFNSFLGNSKKFNIIYFWPSEDNIDLATEISLVFLKLVQFLIQYEAVLNSFVLVTKCALFSEKDCHKFDGSAAILGFCRTFRSEYPNINIKNLDIDHDCSSTVLACAILKAIFSFDSTPFLTVRNGLLNYPQFLEIKPQTLPKVSIPESQCYKLCLPESRRIEDIHFDSFPYPPCGNNEVQVAIEAYGVNFKDVLNITKPTKEFEGMNSVCAEFSGLIIALGCNVKNRCIGQRVCGSNLMQKPMQSIVTVAWEETAPLPPEISFEEGATLPVSFATAHYVLHKCGKIVKGQSILIHSAAGGLGLMCIQLATRLGLNIFVTAGSERKRAYLRNLGIKHVFHSRNLTFVDEILNVTANKGVDVVVNTLTGSGFVNATVNCCSQGARFIEVSKLNIWTIDEFKSVRPDLEIYYIDLSVPDTKIWHPLFQELSTSLKEDSVQPLPFTRFHIENLKQAFKHITQGTHIGKIIVTAPVRNSSAIGPPKLFSSNKTYIVTGGVSGIGLEIAFMLSRGGAKNVVLLSRSLPSKSTLAKINELILNGTSITCKQLDVSEIRDCEELIKYINKAQKIGGIFHCAGVLSDAIISKMTSEDVLKVFEAKVKGTWNLHRLTCNMNLEYFVLFSSMAAIFGNIGQANHAAANSFMDLIANYRHCLGYKALSINWGQWGETGSAVSAAIKGLHPMSTASAVEALEATLTNSYSQIAIFKGNVADILHRFPWMVNYLSGAQKTSERKSVSIVPSINQENNLELLVHIKKLVRENLAELLQIDTEDIQDNTTFESIGVDSLVSVELKNAIQACMQNEVQISANSLIENNTVASFSEYVYNKLVQPKSENADSLLANLIATDKNMCNDLLPLKIDTVANKNIKTVLVTGSTGTMGMYLLENLLKQYKLAKIYCLVRNLSDKSVVNLKSFLVRKNLDLHYINDKIKFVQGDLSKIYLDLDVPTYDILTEEVEAIFNFGASTNHLEDYSFNKNCSVRNVNVAGLKNLVEFAIKRKIKWIFQASTLIAVLKSPKGKYMPETWPEDDEFNEGPQFGYSVSKFIADLILKRAVEYGVPCKVLRFPLVMGDSVTGELDLQNKHFILKILSFLKTGLLPDHKLPSLVMPVDICVDLCGKICFNKDAPSGVYHICPPSPQMEIDVVHKLQSSLKTKTVAVVPYREYIEEQIRLKKESLIWPFIDFYTNPEKYETLIKKAEHMKNWSCNQNTYYRSVKLDQYLPGWDTKIETSFEILEKNFNFLMSKEPEIFK